jgi:formylglycine-generating enzyme required for sulfatase activity
MTRARTVAIGALVATLLAGGVVWWRGQPGERIAAVTPRSASSLRNCTPPLTSGEHPGMAWVPAGAFTMGADHTFPEEAPASQSSVAGFWIDQTEVTNAQFAGFVEATGYRTLAERGVRRSADPGAPTVAGSAVFHARDDVEAMRSLVNWWQFVPGANWRHPQGPGSSIDGREQHPVVHIAYEDAVAYASWMGRSLPTEEQFEYAAHSSGRKSAAGEYISNTWQGTFPSHNTAADGFAGTAPVGCYEANKLGIYDLIGNVWEWTTSPYYARHDFSAMPSHPQGFDPAQPDEKDVAVVKGGSYLCSPDYCMRYRPEARIGQSKGLGTAHIGFRTVLKQQAL